VEKLASEPLAFVFTHDAPLGVEPPSWGEVPDLQDQHRATVSRMLLRDAIGATRPNLVLHGRWHRRNSRVIELPGHAVRVEGLESDQEAGLLSRGVLYLWSLDFEDGREIQRRRDQRSR